MHKEYASKLEKSPVIGVTELKEILLKGYNLFKKEEDATISFATKEEALDYLVSYNENKI